MAIIQLANIPVTNSILKGWKEKNTRHQWSPASNHTIWPHTDNIIATRKWHLRTTRNIHTIYILLHNFAIAPYQLHTSSQCCYSPIPSSRGQEAHVKIFSGPQMSPKMLKMQITSRCELVVFFAERAEMPGQMWNSQRCPAVKVFFFLLPFCEAIWPIGLLCQAIWLLICCAAIFARNMASVDYSSNIPNFIIILIVLETGYHLVK